MTEFQSIINRKDEEILAMNARIKALEEQQQCYQLNTRILKESLFTKEELQEEVSIHNCSIENYTTGLYNWIMLSINRPSANSNEIEFVAPSSCQNFKLAPQ